MKKIKYVIILLSLVLFYFVGRELTATPEDKFIRFLKKEYKKEFDVDVFSRIRDVYSARIYPKEFKGTPKENDDYYQVTGSMCNGKIEDNYLNIVLQDKINDFYSLKLKELFGENIFYLFRIEDECKSDNFQTELLRRKKLYEEDPNKNYSSLKGNIFIFINEKDIKEKELYREKIYEFIEYLKETEAFYYTELSIKFVDEKIFDKETFDMIKQKETEEAIENIKKAASIIKGTLEWGLLTSQVKITEVPVKDREKIKESNKSVKKPSKDMRDVMKNHSLKLTEKLLDKYGEVLISTNIISPRKAVQYTGERVYIIPYEKKEDILFGKEEIKYPNGTIKELSRDRSYYITETKNNKRNGISTKYDSDGKVIWIGEFKNNLLDGPFKEYDKKGNIIEGTYKNNLLEGQLKYYNSNMVMYKEEMYKNNLLEGEQIFYIDGEITGINQFKKGKLDGSSRKFTPNGDVYQIIQWKDGEKNGSYIEFDFDGNIKFVIDFKNGMVDGVRKEFLCGKLLTEENFKENERDGISKIYYYPNENIKKEMLYKSGMKIWEKEYSEEGKLEIINISKEGTSEIGLKKIFNENEKLIKEIEYLDDNREIVREYSEKDGRLISTHYFKNGVEEENGGE